jgi:uncharacterized protein YjbI with pentapeptide repeats
MTLETQPCPKCQTEMFSGARFCVRCGVRLDASGAQVPAQVSADIFTADLKPRAVPQQTPPTVEEIDEGFEAIEPEDDTPIIDVTPRAPKPEAAPEPERDDKRRSQEMAEYSRDEVLRRVRNKQSLKRAGLSGIDLAGVNLEGVDFGRADLDGANLSNAKLAGAVLRNSNLRGAVLTGADLSLADLGRADLTGAKLSSSRLCGADLSHSDLTEADLSQADLAQADLRQATLTRTNLEGALIDQAKRGNESATRYFGKGDVLRDATLEFGEGSVIQVDSRFENCSIALGEGAELTIGEPGVLKNCSIIGRGNIIVHGRFFERASPGIVAPRSLLVSTHGAVVGSIEQTQESTAFAFEPGCRLRVKILQPRERLAAE